MLDICTSVLSLITTVPLSRQPSSSGAPGSAASGFGNTVHDGQLGGWKIPPSQFRPLKAAVEKLVVAMRTLAQQNLLDGANSVENSDVCAGCGELLQALSSLA